MKQRAAFPSCHLLAAGDIHPLPLLMYVPLRPTDAVPPQPDAVHRPCRIGRHPRRAALDRPTQADRLARQWYRGALSGRLEVIKAKLSDVRKRLEKLYEAVETSDLTLARQLVASVMVLAPRIWAILAGFRGRERGSRIVDQGRGQYTLSTTGQPPLRASVHLGR